MSQDNRPVDYARQIYAYVYSVLADCSTDEATKLEVEKN
jgi:hypothetical protein